MHPRPYTLALAVVLAGAFVAVRAREQPEPEGTDPQGGHSLIFEIGTNQTELNRRKARLEELRADLARAREAGDTEKVNDLQLAIERVREDIEELEKAPPSPGDLSQRMIEILKSRIDSQGLRGVEMTPLGNNRIEIHLPAREGTDREDLERLVAQAGVLEFRIVPGLERSGLPLRVTDEEFRRYRDMLEDEGPEAVRKRDGEYIWLPIDADEEGGEQVSDRFPGLPCYRREADGRYYLLVGNTDALTMLPEKGAGGWSLTSARPTLDRTGRPAVEFTFDARGARLFAQMTSAHTGKPMAILVDDIVYSAPVIRSTISEQGIITADFTQRETEKLARTLRTGALLHRLDPEPVSRRSGSAGSGGANAGDRGRSGSSSDAEDAQEDGAVWPPAVAGGGIVLAVLAGLAIRRLRKRPRTPPTS